MVEEFYRTPTRPRGPRSGGIDPRPGEDPDRGGQKTYVPDPGGMTPTDSGGIDPAKPSRKRTDDCD